MLKRLKKLLLKKKQVKASFTKKGEEKKKKESKYISEKYIPVGNSSMFCIKEGNEIRIFDNEKEVFNSKTTMDRFGRLILFQAWLKKQNKK